MIIACHQPNYLPHLGFFDKMKKADVFVIYDTVQFSNGFYVHRNRIRTNTGWMWLTVPVKRHMAPINTIKIKKGAMLSRRLWNEYHWEVISRTYGKTPYFLKYKDAFETIYLKNNYTYLADLNTDLIKTIARLAGIKTELTRLSNLNVFSEDASERLALATEAAARLTGGSPMQSGATYLAGPSGGTKYEMRDEEFTKRALKIAHQEFNHPEYPQLHSKFDGKFEKNIAAIDALFNTGELPI